MWHPLTSLHYPITVISVKAHRVLKDMPAITGQEAGYNLGMFPVYHKTLWTDYKKTFHYISRTFMVHQMCHVLQVRQTHHVLPYPGISNLFLQIWTRLAVASTSVIWSNISQLKYFNISRDLAWVPFIVLNIMHYSISRPVRHLLRTTSSNS